MMRLMGQATNVEDDYDYIVKVGQPGYTFMLYVPSMDYALRMVKEMVLYAQATTVRIDQEYGDEVMIEIPDIGNLYMVIRAA